MAARKRAKAMPLLEQSWDGTADGKARFHKEALVVLRAVAIAAGLGAKDHEVRSNPMGPALAGSAYLLADGFHLWIDGGSRGDWGAREGGRVTARKAAHRKDHAGSGENVSLDWELLWDPASLVEVLKLEGVIA